MPQNSVFIISIKKQKKMNFYHMTTLEQWAKYQKDANYEAESLVTEGFIHCSYAEQVDESLNRYFGGCERVLVIEIDPSLLRSKLVIEKSRNGELFPHIYGQINKSAIVKMKEKIMIF
jgi:uncharacterized protein (DUF952 family)